MSKEESTVSATRRLLDHIRTAEEHSRSETAPAAKASPAQDRNRRPQRSPRTNVFSLGIDLSSEGAVLALSRSVPNPSVEAILHCPVPRGRDVTSPEFYEQCRRAISELPVDIHRVRVWTTLDADLCDLFMLKIPNTKNTNLDAVALLAAKKEKNFNPVESVFDYRIQPTPETALDKVPVLAVRTDSDTLLKQRSRLERMGLHPYGMTSSQLCGCGCFSSGWLTSPWSSFVLVVLEENSTSCLFFRGTTLLMRRVLRTGIEAIRSAIEDESPSSRSSEGSSGYQASQDGSDMPDWKLGFDTLPETSPSTSIPNADPDGTKRLLYSAEVSAPDEDLEALGSVLTRMSHQLERTVEYFCNNVDRDGVSGIIVSAPDGIAGRLTDIFSRVLGRPCRVLSLDGVCTDAAYAEITRLGRMPLKSALFRAVDLSLSSDSTPNLLLPPKARRLSSMHRGMGLGMIAAGVLLCAGLLTLGTSSYLGWRSASERLDRAAAERAGWKEECTPELLKKEIARLQGLQNKARSSAVRRTAAAALSEISANAGENIGILSFRFVPTADAGDRRSGNGKDVKASEGSFTIIINGAAYGNDLECETRLADFFNRLEYSPMFKSLSVSKEPSAEGCVRFTATLRTA